MSDDDDIDLAQVFEYRHFMAKYGEGRCINCGFLCGIAGDTGPETSAFFQDERVYGRVFMHGVNDVFPDCYIGQEDINGLVMDALLAANLLVSLDPFRWYKDQSAADHAKWREQALAVITKDRGCPEWTPWIRYRPPEWHLEQKRMLDLRKLDRAAAQRALITNVVLGIAGGLIGIGQILVGIAALRAVNASTQPQPTRIPSPIVSPQVLPVADPVSAASPYRQNTGSRPSS